MDTEYDAPVDAEAIDIVEDIIWNILSNIWNGKDKWEDCVCFWVWARTEDQINCKGEHLFSWVTKGDGPKRH